MNWQTWLTHSKCQVWWEGGTEGRLLLYSVASERGAPSYAESFEPDARGVGHGLESCIWVRVSRSKVYLVWVKTRAVDVRLASIPKKKWRSPRSFMAKCVPSRWMKERRREETEAGIYSWERSCCELLCGWTGERSTAARIGDWPIYVRGLEPYHLFYLHLNSFNPLLGNLHTTPLVLAANHLTMFFHIIR